MAFAHRFTNNKKAWMKLLRGVVLIAIWMPALVGAQAPTGTAPAPQSAAFRTCDTEGFMALNIARGAALCAWIGLRGEDRTRVV